MLWGTHSQWVLPKVLRVEFTFRFAGAPQKDWKMRERDYFAAKKLAANPGRLSQARIALQVRDFGSYLDQMTSILRRW